MEAGVSFKQIVLLTLFVAATAVTFPQLELSKPVPTGDQSQSREAFYLPSGRGLEILSFGFQNVLADVLWFNTISYFGKHYRSDQNYKWLSHMCGLVISLDPRQMQVYEFCSTMLGWEVGAAEESLKILNLAVQHHPENWYFRYLRGFTFMYFLKQPERATADFVAASKLPGAHPIVARLAARQMVQTEDPRMAMSFLRDLLGMTKDPTARSAIQGRLLETQYEIELNLYDEALAEFIRQHGNPPQDLEQLRSFSEKKLPLQDPFGGQYRFDNSKTLVKSSSGKKRLRDYGNRSRG